MGAAVIGGCDRSETLLTSCVPDLKFNSLPVQLNGSDFLNWIRRENIEARRPRKLPSDEYRLTKLLTKSTPMVEI